MQNIRNLRVWHAARALAKAAFLETRDVPLREYPGLVGQLRRSATSIGSNIAEGAAHHSQSVFARYLQQALASAAETEHHACTAGDLGMLSTKVSRSLAEDARAVQRMLVVLHRKVVATLES